MQETAQSRGGAPKPPRLLRALRPKLPGLAELALWVFAATALGTAGWMQLDAYLYQRAAESTLVQGIAAAPAAPAGPGSTTRPRKPIPPGTPLAKLIVPRLGISVVVAEGMDSAVLRRAIGRIPSSALPGEPGNVALAGHRDTFLRPLADVRQGDLLLLESPTARYAYRVVSIEIVDPHDTHVLDAPDYPALTIVTCYPFRYVGPAPQRFVVQARQVDDIALETSSCSSDAQLPGTGTVESCGAADPLATPREP